MKLAFAVSNDAIEAKMDGMKRAVAESNAAIEKKVDRLDAKMDQVLAMYITEC